MAVPAVKTMIRANINNTTISGNNQNFFLDFKNCQSSFKNSIVQVFYLFNKDIEGLFSRK